MNIAEFDRFADEYRNLHQANVAITGEALEYFAEYKVRALRAVTAGCATQPRRILDFGSGIGNSIPEFSRSFPGAELVCADVSQRSLDLATRRFPGLLRLRVPSHPAWGALGLAARTLSRGQAWRPAVGIRAQPAQSPDAARRQHLPVRPQCPADPGRPAGATVPGSRMVFPRALAALRPIERWISWVPFGAQYSVTAVRAD